MREPRPASQGDLARRATHVFVAPTPYVRTDPPRLAIEPALLGDPAPRTFDFAQLGIPTGVPGPPSGGPGKNGGIGGGDQGGVGDNQGPLAGAEGGIEPNGKFARLTAPVLLYKAEPEYSDEARKAKLQGSVQLLIEIDEKGAPRNIAIRQGLGLGLDQKAIESVKRWRFRPATRNGHPIPSNALIEVFFRLL
jgi:protein TonB